MTTQGVWLEILYQETNVPLGVVGVSLFTMVTALGIIPFLQSEVPTDVFLDQQVLILTVGSGAIGALIIGGLGKAIAMSHPSAAYTVIVAAQLSATLIYEHFGIFGVEIRKVTGWKIFGICLMIVATFFIFSESPLSQLKEFFT